MIKKYKSIYENYEFNSGSDDLLNKEIIQHDGSKDYEDSVNEIIITDIRYEDEDYFNLNQKFGGNPRLSSKSGSFSAFAESQYNNDLSVNRRTQTINNKTQVIYTPKKSNVRLTWKDGKIGCIYSGLQDSPETRTAGFIEPYEVLVISAKSLHLSDERNKNRQQKAKEIRKMGKQKYTLGGKN